MKKKSVILAMTIVATIVLAFMFNGCHSDTLCYAPRADTDTPEDTDSPDAGQDEDEDTDGFGC